jgi:nucleotide-binding universal stress UspA family protein
MSVVLIATDLTEHSEPALLRGRAHAEAVGAEWVVCHVIPDVLRHHPLAPNPAENDVALASDLEKKAAEAVTDQVGRVLRVSPDDYKAVIEIGTAEDAIVRAAEEAGASLIVIGGRPRQGIERTLGHIAERVVRYSHTSVLVARPGIPTGKAIVATDFTEGSLAAVRFGAMLVKKANVDATLLHALQLPGTGWASALAALGSPWTPPPKATVDELATLGRDLLAGLAKEHGYVRAEQVEGVPAEVLVARANGINAEMIIMGSRGRTGLARLVLGSTAEKVIRSSGTSVLVVR